MSPPAKHRRAEDRHGEYFAALVPQPRRTRSRALALLAALLISVVAASGAVAAAERAEWDTKLLALIPKPGFPARAYVAPDRHIYEGTYVNPAGDRARSRVLEYTRRGVLTRSWTVPGQDLDAEHGVQVATSDAQGRLLLLDRTPARALLLNPRNGRFRQYATFADLAPCPLLTVGRDCSPTLTDDPPSANYAAWGPGGELYVTDYLQGVIWRVAPGGGGGASVWLADRRLDGSEFGTTGIVLAPDGRTLLFAQQSSAGLGDGDPATGKLYSVPIRDDGSPGKIHELWESKPVDGPDGFALARNGDVYIALTGSNQIARLDAQGNELDRFPSLPGGGANGSGVPFDNPSSVMFLNRRLIVANQSFITGDASNQALLDVYAGRRGEPEFIPANAGPAGG